MKTNLFLPFILFSILSQLSACNPEIPDELPNILWITIEDTSPHFIGCYGDPYARTPNIDRLAAEGIRFTNAYSTSTKCSPSRFTIITGCRVTTMGTGNQRSWYPVPDSIRGFPMYLRDKGYYTSNNVKTDYNTADEGRLIRESWDESSNKAGWWNCKPGQPFFSVINLMTSHQSRTMTNPRLWYEENVLKKLPEELRARPDQVQVPPYYRDSPEMREEMVRMYNAITLCDQEVGMLLDSLDRAGLTDETIIFFYADHGQGMPRHKTNALNLGYQVPFIVRMPEKYRHLFPQDPGSTFKEIVSFEDLAPTMLSLAGADIPPHMKGRVFMGPSKAPPPGYFHGESHYAGETANLSRSVNDGRFFYTRFYFPHLSMQQYQKYLEVSDIMKIMRGDYAAGLLNEVQAEYLDPSRPSEMLFDLQTDPWEVNNLADDPVYADKLTELREAAEAQIMQSRDVLFMPPKELWRHSIHTTPAEARMDPEIYPLETVLECAGLVGGGPAVIDQQMDFLQHANPVVRYWAAVGLHAQGSGVLPHVATLREAMKDTVSYVQIEIATALYKISTGPRSRAILDQYLRSDNTFDVMQAIIALNNMGEKARPFLPLIREMSQTYERDGKPWRDYEIKCAADDLLHFLDGEPIYYERNLRWIPELQNVNP